jgi:hypothetical protein
MVVRAYLLSRQERPSLEALLTRNENMLLLSLIVLAISVVYGFIESDFLYNLDYALGYVAKLIMWSVIIIIFLIIYYEVSNHLAPF